VIVNSIAQLRFLHGIYPYRRKSLGKPRGIFCRGGKRIILLPIIPAYCVPKDPCVIKMCELLDDENKDLNAFIIGPGWVRTKHTFSTS